MYLPQDFEQTDMSVVLELINAAPLATLVAYTSGGLRADHIPLMMVKDRLIGHVALANDLHEILDANHDVLVVFLVITPISRPTCIRVSQIPTRSFRRGTMRWCMCMVESRSTMTANQNWQLSGN